MTEQFNDIGSLYILENQQWKKVGNGTLILLTNVHKPSHIIVKVIDKNGNPSTANTGTVFQCKPKTKPKGNKSYILKGLDTKTNKEYIIATRFKNEDTATCFKIAVENAADSSTESTVSSPINSPSTSPMFSPSFGSKTPTPNTLFIDSNDPAPYSPRSTMNPSMMRKTLATKPWDCNLCTMHNNGEDMVCRTCNTPRLIMINKGHSTSTEDSPIPDDDPLNSSKLTSEDVKTATISMIYGDPIDAHSPMHASQDTTAFDWNSTIANDKLNIQPNPEGGDIDSTKSDFTRILRTIESNITHQDPLKLFDDLHKVAKRLQRKDPKYRTLDLKNPVVQERLMKIEGVDAYLKYLGFEETSNNKLICPDDQPPRSVIKAAQECCKELLQQWTKKQHIFDLLSQSVKSLREKEDRFALEKDGGNEALQEGNEDEDEDDDEKMEDSVKKDESKDWNGRKPVEQYTLRQLVWSITHESSRDEKQTADVLLLGHSEFAESKDLLELLVERFHGNTTESGTKTSLDNSNGKLTESQLDKRWNIQIKVGSMLSSWMKTFWEQDFESKPGLMEDLEAFFDSIETAFNEDKRVGVLLKKMQGIYNMQYAKYSEDTERVIKHKNMAAMIGKPNNFSMTEQKAVTLAEQFTLMHFKAFKAITKRECLGQSWKKRDGSNYAKNILHMIKLFNQTAKWVQILILTQPTLHKRSKVMRLCIATATYMKNFRNFSGACAVHSALSSTPIYRLKIAWSKLAASDIKKFKELKKIFGFGNNWMLLRKLHRQAHAPAILHTGLFLQDLVGIDEAHENHLHGKVNFKKLLKLHEKIDTISMYQQEQYLFKENLMIQTLIFEDFKAQEHIDDDFLFKISNSVKASDSKKK